MRVLGVNAVFHDPAAALVVDGRIVAAAEEERYSRRKHGKEPVPFSTWEQPVHAIRSCLEQARVAPEDVDLIGFSYDPSRLPAPGADLTADGWEGLRTLYAQRAPRFLATAVPGLDGDRVRFVPHHLAHAASAWLASGFEECAVLTLDGRGERTSHLAGHARGPDLEILHEQALPDSLGLVYEELTAHLGFRRSSDEYKVMALAAMGEPRFLPQLREHLHATGDGGFHARSPDWSTLAPPRRADEDVQPVHADLACSVQHRLQEVLVDLGEWLATITGATDLALAGGVALNCVANSHLAEHGPFERIWVQPAAGDAGTALGAALALAAREGEPISRMTTAALGSGWDDDGLASALDAAGVPYERPADIAAAAAEVLARDGLVAWFQGRAEFGPRALGHRSLLANPRTAANLKRINDVKGREQFRPVAPAVLLDRAADFFEGPLPSPFMLFTHRVRPERRDAIPAAVHVDGTARIQTVDPADEPRYAALLEHLDRLTGVPVVINTSLNTAGRPIVDAPADALEVLGSAPIDALAIGPYLVRGPRAAQHP